MVYSRTFDQEASYTIILLLNCSDSPIKVYCTVIYLINIHYDNIRLTQKIYTFVFHNKSKDIFLKKPALHVEQFTLDVLKIMLYE